LKSLGSNVGRKELIATRLSDRLLFSLSLFGPGDEGTDSWRPITCIDLGVHNMAFATIDLEMNLLKAQRVSLLQDQNIDAAGELPAQLASNLPGDFAAFTHAFINRYLASQRSTANSLYIIEQQMQRQNPRCAIIEAQLHAILYPRTMSISALAVSNFFSLAQATENNQSSSPTAGKPLSYAAKKRAAVQLVDHWIATDMVLNPLSSELTRPDSQLLVTTRPASKRDDLADCVLSCVASAIWFRRSQHKALALLNILSDV
jgi:hypothetical protein